MATVIRASPVLWLPKIQDRIKTVLGFPSERVKIVARKNVPMPHPQDILIRLGPFRIDEGITFEAGRVATVLHRELLVTIRTRLAVDEPEVDTQWILNTTLGHFQTEDKVLDSLQNFQPVDQQSNWLLTEPLQLLSGPLPEKDEQSDDGVSILVFSASYMPVLDQNYQ